MLHILLILKIIGMILLVLLGILLLLVALVLFYPVSYRIGLKASGDVKSLSAEAKATCLLHLITAKATYADGAFLWQVRIFGRLLNFKKKDTPKTENVETAPNDDAAFETEETMSEEQQKPKQSLFEKIRCTIRTICDKIKAIWRIKGDVKSFLTDEVHIRTFGKVKRELFGLFWHFRPRKLKGYARFGLEDPYNTGKVLAGLSVLYPFYAESVDIYPEFEQEILEGDIYMKGHIRLLHFLRILWVWIVDEDIQKTYQHFKKIDFHI